MPSRKHSRRSSQQQQECTVCVASYNILSPTYAMSLEVADEKHLDSQFRLQKVLEKLQKLIDCHECNTLHWISKGESSSVKKTKPIFCLQEIGQSWSGELHKFFQKCGYHFMMASYGNKHSDYFGVGIAFPNDRFELMDAKFIRPSDWKQWVKLENQNVNRDVSLFSYFEESFLSMNTLEVVTWTLLSLVFFWCIWIYFLFRYIKFLKTEIDAQKSSATENEIPWKIAKERSNTMILAKLKCKNSKKEFVISTYHMPCKFKVPVSRQMLIFNPDLVCN
jgi:hypothetical protein